MKHLSIFLFILTTFSLSAAICPDPPLNDDPCPQSVNPPFDLTGVNTHLGTTCCARGFEDLNDDGTPADYPNSVCNNLSAEASVWYVYTSSGASEGYQIFLEPAGLGTDAGASISMEVYWSTDADVCEGIVLDPVAFSCAGLGQVVNIGNCAVSNQKLFIKIGTSSADCGTFSIAIVEESCNPEGMIADECIDLTEIFAPVTNLDFNLDYLCITGCLQYACPEAGLEEGCEQFAVAPTVWMQVQTDDLAQQLFVTVEPMGNWEPVFAIYGGTGCADLQVLDDGNWPDCSDGDTTPGFHHVGVTENSMYWIAVSVDPSSVPSGEVDDGSFEICVSTTINALVCLGEDIGDCADPSLVIAVVDREVEGGDLSGPFCQGELVTINVSFLYDASESGGDWLHGLIPDFGSGWDLDSFDFAANAPTGNGTSAEWFEEGGALAPIIQEDVPILCTYRDDDGRLRLCNQLCEPCSECTSTVEAGDALPSGYFWISAGGGVNCENDGSPGGSWGIGSTQAGIDWQFTLRVKTFASASMCEESGDLRIAFQTFSDGVTGCWEDPFGECILDRAMIGPQWEIGCSELPPDVVAVGDTICSEDLLDIDVSTADGSLVTVRAVHIANPFVSGASDYDFEAGFGTIVDQLVNISNVEQIQQYDIFSLDDGLVCRGIKQTIDIVVRPERLGESVEDVCECDTGGCTTLSVSPIPGATYLWSTGEQTSTITVCPVGIEQYSVTVTEDGQCPKVSTALGDCSGGAPFCTDPSELKILYNFYVDENINGVQDSAEALFADGSFMVVETGDIIYNTTAALSSLFLEEGSYQFKYDRAHLPDWSLTSDSIVAIDLDSANNCAIVAFGITNEEIITDFVTYTNFNQRCNTEQIFRTFLLNAGTTSESGILWIELHEVLFDDYFFDNNVLDTFLMPNKIGWFFEELPPGEKFVGLLDLRVPGPPDFPVGGILSHKFYAEVSGGPNAGKIYDEKMISRPVLCGYDPNDKAVTPDHPEGYTDLDEMELTYRVRFQNTGNDVAYDIEVRDTLSEYLDVSSVRYLSGSHDQYLTFSRSENKVLTFRYDGIYLPDSLSDPEGSQGYLIYSVDILPGLPEGTVIENTAHIYFDNNPPIVTNTTNNALYDDADEDGYFSIEDCNDNDADINPAQEEIPNNDVDEDCDGEVLIIDQDMDGFNSDEDCDDTDPDINPDAEEIINNDVDENCDGTAIVIDNDNDGFNSDEDCDDNNEDIYPGALEIPDNGIDEDCDGEDEITMSVSDVNPLAVVISPNPTRDLVTITSEARGDLSYSLLDTRGRVVMRGAVAAQRGVLDLSGLSDGIYMLILSSSDRRFVSYHKVLRIL